MFLLWEYPGVWVLNPESERRRNGHDEVGSDCRVVGGWPETTPEGPAGVASY